MALPTLSKDDLSALIKRRLGAPMIKVELSIDQIYDAIDYARDRFVSVAIGNATREEYITMMLSGGQSVYDMPDDVTELVEFIDGAGAGGIGGKINTLFTIENYFYSQGMLANTRSPFDLVGYHIALDFMETLQRYVHSDYVYRYNRYDNQLIIDPAPPTGHFATIVTPSGDIQVDSPGWCLMKVYKIQGEDEHFYNERIVQDYAYALAMRTLGLVRRKSASLGALGNQPLSLDGSDLVSEAQSLIEQYEETLENKYCWAGYGIVQG